MEPNTYVGLDIHRKSIVATARATLVKSQPS